MLLFLCLIAKNVVLVYEFPILLPVEVKLLTFPSGNKPLHKINIKKKPHSNEFGAPVHKDVFMHTGLPSSRRALPVSVSVYLFVRVQ